MVHVKCAHMCLQAQLLQRLLDILERYSRSAQHTQQAAGLGAAAAAGGGGLLGGGPMSVRERYEALFGKKASLVRINVLVEGSMWLVGTQLTRLCLLLWCALLACIGPSFVACSASPKISST